MKLPEKPDTFLLAVVSRLVEQKGINLVCEAAPSLFEDNVQLVVLGDGELRYKRWLRELAEKYPHQMAVQIGYDETLAHQFIAGADAFLMPSQYEPSGLNQLYSMKFGTPSIVRATGGLADTVTDTTPASLVAGEATGFTFGPFEAGAFRDAVRRALALYRDKPDCWLQVMKTGMRRQWSWEKSAAEYERLYAVMVGE
jgi:starch synthase